MQSTFTLRSTINAWIVVLTAALFFFYEFIQMNMFNAISEALMKAFSINAEQLGKMSAFYFVANVVFLFPAGIFLDRFATRAVILSALLICIIGTGGLAFTHTFFLACFFRFLTGIGAAFCFLSVIRLASRWFPPHRMALITGLVVTMAMLGGMVSQAPLTLLLQYVSWREALLWDAALGIFIFILIAIIVKDYPKGHHATHLKEQEIIRQLGFGQSLKKAFIQTQNWLAGLYTLFMNLPIGLLGGLWGILYLMKTHGLTHLQAAEITSMLFLGTVIGSPIVGWASDRMGRRCLPMMIGALLSLGLILYLIFSHQLTFYPLLILFLLIGATTSTQIISYPFVAESSQRIITAMSVSAVNISVQGGDALFQPFFGYLMDSHAYARLHHYTTNFIAADFHWAMWMFPIGFVLAFIIPFLLRETYCSALPSTDETSVSSRA